MRTEFDEQLETLNKEMITMGMLCENAISRASEALFAGDVPLAKSIERILEHINHRERAIEDICMHLILQQQPVATDLRVISSALKMVTDMERVGDQSADIGEIVSMGKVHITTESEYFQKMSAAVIRMVSKSMDAFVRKDENLAESVIEYDDTVDDYFNTIRSDLIRAVSTDVKNGESIVDQLMIAKYYERIGDHAVNIARWVIFSITGQMDGE